MSKPIACPECGTEISGDYMSSDPARRFFFAALRDAHANLRDEHLQLWPNPEIMRKHCLIAIGYCDQVTVICTKATAPQIANTFRLLNQYCVAKITNDIVTVYTAKTMARRALPKKQFLEVARRVFDHIAQTTGIDPAQSLEGRAA
jgi:hypothetical protein